MPERVLKCPGISAQVAPESVLKCRRNGCSSASGIRIQTTEDYLRVDVTQRISVLAAVTPPQLRPGKFRPPDALIALLTG